MKTNNSGHYLSKITSSCRRTSTSWKKKKIFHYVCARVCCQRLRNSQKALKVMKAVRCSISSRRLRRSLLNCLRKYIKTARRMSSSKKYSSRTRSRVRTNFCLRQSTICSFVLLKWNASMKLCSVSIETWHLIWRQRQKSSQHSRKQY
jgi:hypothetical protein